MTLKTEYDFLNWTSFPSSFKLFNNERAGWARSGPSSKFPVTPGKTLRLIFKAKQKDVLYTESTVPIVGWDGTTWKWIVQKKLPLGGFDWQEFSVEIVVPTDISAAVMDLYGGAGSPEEPGITWFDDLKVYQDDMLIYSDDFSKWDPVIGAGVGAGILGVVVPALVRVPEPGVAYEYQKPMLEKEPLLAAGLAGLGVLVGGGIGLLTALGIIPVPTIPSLGATPEEPGAPARLGKYQITG